MKSVIIQKKRSMLWLSCTLSSMAFSLILTACSGGGGGGEAGVVPPGLGGYCPVGGCINGGGSIGSALGEADGMQVALRLFLADANYIQDPLNPVGGVGGIGGIGGAGGNVVAEGYLDIYMNQLTCNIPPGRYYLTTVRPGIYNAATQGFNNLAVDAVNGGVVVQMEFEYGFIRLASPVKHRDCAGSGVEYDELMAQSYLISVNGYPCGGLPFFFQYVQQQMCNF